MITDFFNFNFVGKECAYGEIWAFFYGQVGCKLNWPLPQRKWVVIFREYFALNPCSLYPGSCSFGLWLPSIPQFWDFIAYHNFCFVILIMLRFFAVDKIFCILRHLNDNRVYPHKGEVFWSLQVLWRWHQRCRWGRGPAGSLAHLSLGEVELLWLLSNSVQCVAEAARCQLDQFKRSKLPIVPGLANLVAMFGQFVETPCFFSNVKGHCHGCFFYNIWTHWKAKNCEIDSCKWSDLQKSLARGTATDCFFFIPTHLFWALQVLLERHQCGWGRRPAGSLAQLSPGEVGLCWWLSNSVQCMAEAARRQLDQFERSRLWFVPRFANLVAMFGQFG